jgi:drug/metabolite transporter (DMT)-like permease
VGLTGVTGCWITPLLLFAAYKTLPSGTATVFHFIYPAVVALGGLLVFREKKSPRELLAIAVCVVGIALFYDPGQPLDWKGAVLALLSGVTYAAYVLMLSVFQSKQITGFLFNFYVTVVCTVFTLIICLVTNSLALPASLAGWGLCVVFSLLVTTGAVVLFQQSTFLIGGDRASILSTLEPITSVVLGCIFFQEPFGIRVALATALVVMASILIVLPGRSAQENA